MRPLPRDLAGQRGKSGAGRSGARRSSPKPLRRRITAFSFPSGLVLAGKYEILHRLGAGWEGEVYLVRELRTGIERTAKFWYPQRNPQNRVSNFYARKLHHLRSCPIIIQYHTQDTVTVDGLTIPFLVSEFVEGELLTAFLRRQPERVLTPFQALHLLHALAAGMEAIHNLGEYHGDLHTDNIIVQRYGLGFELKLLDLYEWKGRKQETIQDDVLDLVRIFYDALGGQPRYAKQPAEVKAICCGLKRSLILKKFKTAGQLRVYLETMQWR